MMAATILIVDNEPTIPDSLEPLLRGEGYSVVRVQDGQEALALTLQLSPDLLVLDGVMAVLDGLSLCRLIKTDKATQGLPVILMTASRDTEDVWLRSGADAVVRKPFQKTEILLWVRTLIEMKRAREDLDRAENTLIAIAAAIEARSLHRESHVRQVADLSVRLAFAAGLDAEAVAIIRKAALLHDVGKIWVPETILRKPGRLTEQEFAAVKRHAVQGAALCAALPKGKEISIIVRRHHERWDGLGYPDGLAGPEIPLGARIVAVADAFDAFTADRPYRSSKSTDETLEAMWLGAGSQWDPHLVELLEHIILQESRGDGGSRAVAQAGRYWPKGGRE